VSPKLALASEVSLSVPSHIGLDHRFDFRSSTTVLLVLFAFSIPPNTYMPSPMMAEQCPCRDEGAKVSMGMLPQRRILARPSTALSPTLELGEPGAAGGAAAIGTGFSIKQAVKSVKLLSLV
jgi:hypothetical protein